MRQVQLPCDRCGGLTICRATGISGTLVARHEHEAHCIDELRRRLERLEAESHQAHVAHATYGPDVPPPIPGSIRDRFHRGEIDADEYWRLSRQEAKATRRQIRDRLSGRAPQPGDEATCVGCGIQLYRNGPRERGGYGGPEEWQGGRGGVLCDTGPRQGNRHEPKPGSLKLAAPLETADDRFVDRVVANQQAEDARLYLHTGDCAPAWRDMVAALFPNVAATERDAFMRGPKTLAAAIIERVRKAESFPRRLSDVLASRFSGVPLDPVWISERLREGELHRRDVLRLEKLEDALKDGLTARGLNGATTDPGAVALDEIDRLRGEPARPNLRQALQERGIVLDTNAPSVAAIIEIDRLRKATAALDKLRVTHPSLVALAEAGS